MARAQLKPKLIFWRCVDLLVRNKVQIPGYHRLAELIWSALNQHQRELVGLVKDVLTPDIKRLIDSLFVQAECEGDQPTKMTRYKLTFLKNLSQSTKPTKVREKADDLDYLAKLYRELAPVLSAMNLNYEGIRYYAGSVIKAKVFQLNQRSDKDRYVHVIAFAHQYYRLQDNLVDVLLTVIQSFQNSAQREHKEQSYDNKYFPERRNVPLTEVLVTVNQHCGFLDDLQHWQQRHARRSVSQRSLYAGVIGRDWAGMGIGPRKLAQISSHITENELEHAVNWYYSLDNVQAANDRIVAAIDRMELPNVYRRLQDQLHTSSDGQKFEVQCYPQQDMHLMLPDQSGFYRIGTAVVNESINRNTILLIVAFEDAFKFNAGQFC
jgi:hypothetical protein